MERSHVTTFIILVVLAIAAGSIGSIGPLQGSTANVTSVTPGQSGITFAVTTSPSRTAVAVNPQSGRLASTSLPKGAGGYSVTKRAESSVTNQVESPGTYSFHIMSEGVSGCTAINPTTTFLYSDAQAWVLFEATISSSFQVQFYSRDTTSRNWDLYYDSGLTSASAGTYCVGGYIYVSGYWPASNYPRAWMVEVYLDGSAAFLEFFEVTDYNLSNGNVFETATGVDSNNNPINPGQTVFTVGVQSAAYAYLRLNDIAYCSEAGFTACGDTNGHVHTLLAEWYLNGGFYSSYSNFWADYKNTNLDYNFWSYGYDPYDYITIGSSTVGSWVVYLYLDQYYNGGSVWYGPVAEISFTVQAASSTASTSTITTTSTSGATTTTTTSATIFSTQTAYVTTPTTTLTTSTTTSTSAITPFATTTSIVTATVTTPTTSTKTLTSTTSQTLTSSHTTTSSTSTTTSLSSTFTSTSTLPATTLSPSVTKTTSTTTTVTGTAARTSTTTFTSILSTATSTSTTTISTGRTTMLTATTTTGTASATSTSSTTTFSTTTVSGTVTVSQTDTFTLFVTRIIQTLLKFANEVLKLLGTRPVVTPKGQKVVRVTVTRP